MKTKLLAERIRHERELREASESAIEHEREMRMVFDRHERQLRKAAERAVEKARSIQFTEYERRLQNLNHAHEQAVQAQLSTVPREMYDAYREASERRFSAIEQTLGSLTGREVGASSTIRWALAGIAALVGVVGLILVATHTIGG